MTIPKISLWFLIAIFVSLPGSAQNPQPPHTKPAAAEKPAEAVAIDPLGRTTPRGTVMGFLHVGQYGEYNLAAQYFQRVKSRSIAKDERLAQDLKVLMDQAYVGKLNRLSELPEGSPQEGLPPNEERVGRIVVDQSDEDLILVRVNNPAYGQIWLFSPNTLANVSDLYDQIEVRSIESKLPESLVENSWLGMPLWQWLAVLLLIPAAMFSGWIVIQVLYLVGALLTAARTRSFQYRFRPVVSAPGLLIFAAMIHDILVLNLKLPLLHHHYYSLVIDVLLIMGFCWLTVRIIDWLSQRVRISAFLSGHAAAGSLILLGQRILKVLVIVAAILGVLRTAGFNMTTALAGVGIGGIAVALAAQKTLENVIGGVSLLSDEAIRVGDVYRFGATIGTVEDISLRSTRIRTLDRVDLFIPNGALATMNIENLSKRDKFLIDCTVGLRTETSRDQLIFVLHESRSYLSESPKIEPETARVRFSGFGESSLNVEIFCYVRTSDAAEYFAIREDLFLRVMEAVHNSGTGFSTRFHSVSLSRDPGRDLRKSEVALNSSK